MLGPSYTYKGQGWTYYDNLRTSGLAKVKTIEDFDKYMQSGYYQDLVNSASNAGNYFPRRTTYNGMTFVNNDAQLYKDMELKSKNDKLKNEYQTKYDEAKAANEKRYNEILAGYNTTYGNVSSQYDTMYNNVMDQYDNMGQAEIAELRRNYGIAGNKQMASLQSAGLMNSTVAPTVQRQNQDASARAEMLLNEKLRSGKIGTMATMQSNKIGTLASLDQAKYGVMERREDSYPDFNVMLQLAKGLGNS